MPSIFVQIAAYRDPELIPTIKHCLERAKNPQDLTFGICYQYNEGEENKLEEFENDSRFKITKVPYQDSKGACWARSKCNELYNGEDFSLQIDSHMRFVPDWDEVILAYWKNFEDPKTILTAYPPQYEPGQPESEWKTVPHMINVHSFKDGQTEQRPDSPKTFLEKQAPYRAVHVAAGFIFGPGSWVTDVPYDPEFYFGGEETALGIRMYTHGYNIYHPHIIIVYHYYERKNESKHWSDDKEWGAKSIVANDRLNCLLTRNKNFDLGKYDIGNERTLRDWEIYSGIDYARNIIHMDTVAGKEPPVDLTDITKWSYEKKTFKKIVQWDYSQIEQCDDIRFWGFFFKDQNGHELHRLDFKFANHPEGSSPGCDDIISGKVNQMEFEFKYYFPAQTPKTFMIWPYSNSKGWLNSASWPLP
jgi:Glycosyltransferase (GlcNAc)